MRHPSILPLVLLTAACQSAQILTPPPALTPVGTGLGYSQVVVPVSVAETPTRAPASIWTSTDRSLFRDLRAHAVGDIVTVSIDIDDKAQFDNASGRSKSGSAKAGFGAALGLGGFGAPDRSGNIDGNLDLSGSASAKGEGSIDRSEKLHLLVAAVVAGILPNGNLLISGSQEVRVNNEVRVLNIAGIVRPLDISDSNLIGYDKIAEARVSYGGRGKLTAVQ